MNWSKVQKGRKPIGWWYHKIMCEVAYNFLGSGGWYYYHLNILCRKYKINLYGRKIQPNTMTFTDKTHLR